MEELALVSTSMVSPVPSTKGESCGWIADSFEEGATERKLTFGVGPREELEPLLEIAEKCELNGVELTDQPSDYQDIYRGEVPDDWVGLVVEGSLNPQAGPFSCFGLLANRQFGQGF